MEWPPQCAAIFASRCSVLEVALLFCWHLQHFLARRVIFGDTLLLIRPRFLWARALHSNWQQYLPTQNTKYFKPCFTMSSAIAFNHVV